MEAKRKKVTTQSTALEETEDCQQRVPWNTLNPYVLEMIYSFLCRKDQINMSVVCRDWSEGYSTPSVWRKFIFSLNMSKLSTSDRLYMKYAEKYSKHFRHVRIICHKLSERHMYSIWSRRFIYFLEILIRNSQLKSVEFLNLGLCLYSDHANNTRIYETIAEFLMSQTDLKMLLFIFSFFTYKEGDKLFKILAETQGKSLELLIIRHYFTCEIRSEEILDDLEEFPRILAFPKLKALVTDYSFVLDYLLACHFHEIEKLEKNDAHVLSKVQLLYDEIKYDKLSLSKGLTPDQWKILTTLFPNMQVIISIKGKESIFVNMTSFIRLQMPIKKLALHCMHHNIEMEIDEIFNRLRECETNDYLETLVFQCLCERIGNFKPFLSFIEVCTKLKYLILSAMEPLHALALIESLKENRSETLKGVFIVDKYMKNNPDYPKFKNTFDKISPKLRFILKLGYSSIENFFL